MKGKALIVLAVLTVGCTVGLVAGADPDGPETTRWEYAVYRSWGHRYQWQTPDTDIFSRGLPDFFRQLGVKTAVTESMAEVVLINHFGQQGWEMIEMSPPNEDRGTWITWFKRPRR
jgi:hypothetical protein